MADKLREISAGIKLHARYSDGEFYPAEVISVAEGKKRGKAPVKVHFSGYAAEDDAWKSLDDLKSKALGLTGTAANAKATAKAKAVAPAKPDYSGLTKGMRLQCSSDGKYYSAEVVVVSKKQTEAPVKVHWVGYTAASDEWVGAERIRSKALTCVKPVAKAKAGKARERPAPIKAFCAVGPKGKPCGGGEEVAGECYGTVAMTQIGAKCKIRYVIRGLKPGKHGFHIHDKSDFSDGCASAGPHYNPHGKTHGAPGDEERHVGDLGNIVPDADGVAKGTIMDTLIKLDGEFSVIGRSIMIHADEDDLGTGDNSEPGPPPVNGKASKATGNAGARIACGEITLVPGPVRLVIFDFDQTISMIHVFKYLAGWTSSPPKCGGAATQLGQLRLIDKLSGESEYADGGFALHAMGGRDRVERLRRFFGDLRRQGAELIICSKGLVAAVRKCLSDLKLLSFFAEVYARLDDTYNSAADIANSAEKKPSTDEDRLLGTKANGDWECKLELILKVMRKRDLRKDQVLFVEDDRNEIAMAQDACETEFVQEANGMTEDNMATILAMVSKRKPRNVGSDNILTLSDAQSSVRTILMP